MLGDFGDFDCVHEIGTVGINTGLIRLDDLVEMDTALASTFTACAVSFITSDFFSVLVQ